VPQTLNPNPEPYTSNPQPSTLERVRVVWMNERWGTAPYPRGNAAGGSLKPLFVLAFQKLNTNEGFQRPNLAIFSGMRALYRPEMGVFAPPSPFLKNV
jgi:hypothetical protein